jgi:hypothetical protein
VVPARNFVMGNGFVFAREGGETVINVPPLYSLTLIPIYFFNLDARSFYFANVLLGIISIVLLFKISQKLSKSVWSTGLLLFTYVTSFVIYWQTSLAMAENVLLAICLANLYLALQPLNTKNLILATFLAVACYGSKYVSLPITGVFLLFIGWRIVTEEKEPQRLKRILLVSVLATTSFLFFNGSQLFHYLKQLFEGSVNNNLEAQTATSWLSVQYFRESFPKYFSALMGSPIYNLWHTKAILPTGLALIVLLWCLFAIFKLAQYRKLAILVFALTLAQLAFLSVILMIEGRYAFTFIPIILTGAAAMLGWLKEKSAKKLMQTKIENSTEKPIIISSLSPFVWDFYRQGDYLVLPLSNKQDMVKEKIWGEDFNSDQLTTYYQEQLQAGRLIYLATVGFGRNDWSILDEYKANGLELKLLKEDCVGACKIYRVNFINVIQ